MPLTILRGWVESILFLSRTYRRRRGGTWYKVREQDFGGWSTGRNVWTLHPLPDDLVLEREDWPAVETDNRGDEVCVAAAADGTSVDESDPH